MLEFALKSRTSMSFDDCGRIVLSRSRSKYYSEAELYRICDGEGRTDALEVVARHVGERS